ncbi:MAG: sulfide/dihydroorotate dehydrogenase-like FAD/NAD-binding protein [Candidatus Aenigmarchaeota archaeon]|nr:sulfide/dihydroorotate dehydrogenase-like FAD/NAD-binding protein [Candidatus Aenigmarchaeota archaeon]
MKHEISRKEDINSEDYLIEVKAPLVAERFRAGHFVVLLTHPKGERIPMSVLKAEDGKISILIEKLGKTSRELDTYKVGDMLEAVIGPMGNPISLKEYGNVVFASDLVCGHAENYAVSKALGEADGNHVISMQTFPTKDLIYLEKELRGVSDEYYITTMDGSYGIKGHYLDVLERLLKEGRVDMVFAGGDVQNLKRLAELTESYNVPAMVTLRPIMVDATGMCGSCRVFIDGEMKLACIDGPMFDAHKVDFDGVISAMNRFKKKEEEAMENYNRKEVTK